MSRSIILTAHITAKPEATAKVKNILLKLQEESLKEQGCLYYELTINKENSNEFVFFEKWDSQANLDKHRKAAHIFEAREALKGLLAKEIEHYFFESI